MLENSFQSGLIKRLKKEFPESIILKNDPNYKQGIPDLIIINENKWAALECKKSKNESHRPNQDYYIERMNKMSYANFIYPENKEEVIDDLKRTFGS